MENTYEGATIAEIVSSTPLPVYPSVSDLPNPPPESPPMVENLAFREEGTVVAVATLSAEVPIVVPTPYPPPI